jgi:PAS domain S-box-containing protein
MNRYRLLIVEEEAIAALDIKDRLAGMGYDLLGHATTGELALELTQKLRPDLVLMDIRLQGDMDGITAAQEIRRRFHVPVIFLTAYSEDEILERAKLAAPYGYILKPFDDRELKSAVEIALYKHRAEEEIRRLNRLYEVLSQVNQTVVRVQSREELLSDVCQLLVERGDVDLAWIGWLDPATSQLIPVAWAGENQGLLTQVTFAADSRPAGQGDPDQAIRSEEPSVCNSCAADHCFPAAHAPERFGFQSCGSFPLRFQKQVCAVLNICVAEPGFFGDREIKLLREVAQDVSFALDKIEADAKQQRLNEELQERSAFLTTLLEALPLPVFYKDAQLRYLGCNAAYERFLGVSRDRLIGKLPHDLWPPDLAGYYQQTDQIMFRSTEMHVYEGYAPMTDGSRKDVVFHKAAYRAPDGGLGGIIGIVEDVTERKAAGLALRESEERFRAMFESSSVGMAQADPHTGRFLRVNQKMSAITGFTTDELLKMSFREITHPTDVSHDWNSFQQVMGGETPSYHNEKRYIRKDGAVVWVNVNSTLHSDSAGQPLYSLAVIEDITARKEAEAEIRRLASFSWASTRPCRPAWSPANSSSIASSTPFRSSSRGRFISAWPRPTAAGL